MIGQILDLALRLLAVCDVYEDGSEAGDTVAVKDWAAGDAHPPCLARLGDDPALAWLDSPMNHGLRVLDGGEVIRVDEINDRAADNLWRAVSGDLLPAWAAVSYPPPL